MTRVLVCGGRDFDDGDLVWTTLDALEITALCHGAARGVDTLASQWCEMASDATGVEEYRFPADWHTHGKAAGPIRNQQMLTEFKPELVVAFAGGRGTADMVRRARAAGVAVQLVGAIDV